MFAIRDDREYVNQEDLTKAARKVGEAKKHEGEFLYICTSLPFLIQILVTAKMEYST
jgi:26S proteasome regulatory subunit T4